MSHPMWVRGLKLGLLVMIRKLFLVAPHVGAWIETPNDAPTINELLSRTPCGCVD